MSQRKGELQKRAQSLPVSAFVIALNEADKIEDCLRSVSECEEIILVDSGSSDDTILIAERLQQDGLPIRIFHQSWLGYAAQKQFALEKCRQPWCLSIDADERLDEELRSQLPKLINCDDLVVGWRFPRRGYLPGFGFTPFWVKEHAMLRLIRNGTAAYDLTLDVHEKMIPKGKVKTIKRGSLLHFTPHLIDEQILKENKYSTLKADMIVRKGGSRSPWRLLISPPMYFFRLYLKHGLWRCGFPGFIQAATGAVYSFLTEAKVYQRRTAEAIQSKGKLQ